MATAREEAERLVAAALAAASFASRAAGRSGANRDDRHEDRGPSLDDLAGLASLAARFLGGRPAEPPPAPAPAPSSGHQIANGSAECCVCPICRAISAIRDPSPEFAERLATGASDLAAGLTSILRAFGEAARRSDTRPVVEVAPAPAEPEGWPSDLDAEAEPAAEDDSPWPGWSDFGSVWQAATRAQDQPHRTAKTAPATPSPSASAPPVKKAVAKKAVAKKTVAKKAVAKKTVAAEPEPPATATEPVPKKAVAKKAAAKKAAPKKAAQQAGGRKTASVPRGSGIAGAKSTADTSGSAKKSAAKKTPAKKASGPGKHE